MSDQDGDVVVQDAAAIEENKPMTLTQAWGFYGGGLAIVMLLASVKWYGVMCLAYLAVGVVMSRVVMRQIVEFHPMYDTVANVFSTKVRMVLFWPLQMFGLLFKLSVNRVL